MRASAVVMASALAASGCVKSPDQIADAACPFIAVTTDSQKAKRLQLLVGEGMNASKAADVLEPYEFILPDKSVIYDKREVCVALVTENKAEKDRVFGAIARQAVQQVRSRSLIN